jgi:hypothetical protein
MLSLLFLKHRKCCFGWHTAAKSHKLKPASAEKTQCTLYFTHVQRDNWSIVSSIRVGLQDHQMAESVAESLLGAGVLGDAASSLSAFLSGQSNPFLQAGVRDGASVRPERWYSHNRSTGEWEPLMSSLVCVFCLKTLA